MVKLSIIITTHNTRAYLRKCIDSVIYQTLHDIEIFIVDDASDDNPEELLISQYASESRLHFVRLDKSRGPGGARNAALEKINGKYVAFLDSDDWVELNFYEQLYISAEKYHADVAMAGLVRNFDYETPQKIYKCCYLQEYSLNGDTAFRIMTGEYDIGIKIIPSALNKIYRRTFLKAHQITFLENIFFEDQLFSYQILLEANKVICVPNILYHHYKRSGSIVQSFNRRNIDDMVFAYREIRNYLEITGVSSKYLYNYYRSLDHFYNLIIRQIFEFVPSENEKKELLKYSFEQLQKIITIEEYFQYSSAEEIRQHFQPGTKDTVIN